MSLLRRTRTACAAQATAAEDAEASGSRRDAERAGVREAYHRPRKTSVLALKDGPGRVSRLKRGSAVLGQLPQSTACSTIGPAAGSASSSREELSTEAPRLPLPALAVLHSTRNLREQRPDKGQDPDKEQILLTC